MVRRSISAKPITIRWEPEAALRLGRLTFASRRLRNQTIGRQVRRAGVVAEDVASPLTFGMGANTDSPDPPLPCAREAGRCATRGSTPAPIANPMTIALTTPPGGATRVIASPCGLRSRYRLPAVTGSPSLYSPRS